MIRLDSGVLQRLGKLLRTTGGAQQVDFDDGLLQQVLDVSKVVRRGGTLADVAGVWSFPIPVAHAVAGNVDTDIDPYAFGTAYRGYPSSIDSSLELDAWLVGPFRVSESVLGACDGALISLRTGVSTDGSSWSRYLAMFTGAATAVTGFANFMTEEGTGQPFPFPWAIRVPRGWKVRVSTRANAAVTVTFHAALALFPAGLGQDAIGAG